MQRTSVDVAPQAWLRSRPKGDNLCALGTQDEEDEIVVEDDMIRCEKK